MILPCLILHFKFRHILAFAKHHVVAVDLTRLAVDDHIGDTHEFDKVQIIAADWCQVDRLAVLVNKIDPIIRKIDDVVTCQPSTNIDTVFWAFQ